MKIDEAVKILRAHNEWRRAPAHLPEDAMPAMGDPRKISIAIDTVCDALSKSGDWTRAAALEEAAGVCEVNADRWPGTSKVYAAMECAAAIRQLKDKT